MARAQAQLATALARQQRLEESLECFAAAQHAHAAYAGISRVLSQQRSSREKSLTPYALCLTNACFRSSAARGGSAAGGADSDDTASWRHRHKA